MKTKVAVIGSTGWVGRSMMALFPDAYEYTSKKGLKSGVNECDVAFVCVPTPSVNEGRLDTSIITGIMTWCTCPLIVIRSTTNPGDCEFWSKVYDRNVVHQPEYLGETPAHPLLDTTKAPFIIMGGEQKDTRKLIELYTTVYNANIKIRQVSLLESEIIKLSENRAIAFKVAQCQELYDVCEKQGVDYYTVREAVYGDDPRFDPWFSFIFPAKRGFNSKCIPKDIYAWVEWAKEQGYDPKITRAILEKNKEWIS